MESSSYGENRPRKPWWGQLQIQHNPGGETLVLHTVCSDGTIDDDSNASAYVQPEDLFDDPAKPDAMIEYRRRLSDWALGCLEAAREALRELAAKE
jgi:hypothetical protein